jgi:hypothetical protein
VLIKKTKKMRQEEAQLKLKKYHSKIFAKQSKLSDKNDNDFDIFNVFGKLSQEIKPITSMKLLDALAMHLNLNKH